LRSNHPGLWVRPMQRGSCEATILNLKLSWDSFNNSE